MTCPKCGESIDSAEAFCSNCGAETGASVADIQTAESACEKKVDPVDCLFKTSVDIKIPDLDNKRFENLNDENICSDCKEFHIEWNKGTSIFFSGIASSLQFKIRPVGDQAKKAGSFRILLRYPGDERLTEDKFPMQSITREISRNINFLPLGNIGVNQSVEFYFTYKLNDREHWYFQQLPIDIHSTAEPKDKILDNLTINIGSIVQEGKAGDPRISFLENLKRSATSINDILEKLKTSNHYWTPLDLFDADEPDDAPVSMNISSPPMTMERAVMTTAAGFKITVFSGNVSLGRRKECDIVTRNLPPPGVEWPQEKLHSMNERISGTHCQIGISGKNACIKDLRSANGTYLSGQKIGQDDYVIPENRDLTLSLGKESTAPYNFMATVKTLREPNELPKLPLQLKNSSFDAGTVNAILIKRKDKIPEAYAVLVKWIQLSHLTNEYSPDWILCRYKSAFALTNGKKWFWLAPETTLPAELEKLDSRLRQSRPTDTSREKAPACLNLNDKSIIFKDIPSPENRFFQDKAQKYFSRYEVLQIAAFSFHSPYIQQNPSYYSRVSSTRFIFDDDTPFCSLVNAFAAEGGGPLRKIGIDIAEDKPIVVLFEGLVTASFLAGLCVAIREKNQMLVPGLRLISERIIANDGFFSTGDMSSVARKLNIDINSLDDVTIKNAKSFTASMLLNIISHELGHIALNHTVMKPPYDPQTSRNNERQADLFASSVVSGSLFNDYLVGGSIVWWILQAWVDRLPRFQESTHPDSRERLFNFINANREEAEALGFTESAVNELLPKVG